MKKIGVYCCLFIFSIATVCAAGRDQRVTFKTNDGLTLHGTWLPAENKKPTLVLLHGLASTKEEWRSLAAAMGALGWGVLAYDARGHGESSITKDGQGYPNGFRYFGGPGNGSSWEKMIDDVGAAVRFLEREKKIDRNSIVFGGASLGANVCLSYAGLTSLRRPVVLLSPAVQYQNIEAVPALRRLAGAPILMIAHPNDRYSYESVLRFKKEFPGITVWTTGLPAGHGVQMLDESTLSKLSDWLTAHQ